jgi:hypothetical protein
MVATRCALFRTGLFRTGLFRTGLLVLAGASLFPAAAQAWWRGGVYFGFPPVVVAPPPAYYYPPPVYVGPPPVYAAPPPIYSAPPPIYSAPPPGYSSAPPSGQACYAGPWVCPMQQPTASGSSCFCIANGDRVWGRTN